MFESLCNLFKKKKKRSIPYTDWNEEMDYVGISMDEFYQIESDEKFEKIIKKNLDSTIKQLPEISDVELQKTNDKVKKWLRREFDVAPELKKRWAAERQKIFYSELDRLFKAVREELQKRKSK